MSHLEPDQLQAFRERLEAAREAIESLLEQTRRDTRPVDLNLPIGRLTRIDAIQMRSVASMGRQQLDVRRQQVEAALEAFDNGTYGVCRSCKSEIGLGRLEYLPETPFCLECQEMFETR